MPSPPEKPPKGTHPPLPATVWLVSWVSLLGDVSGEMVSPLLPLFVVGVLHASRTDLGIIEGAAVLIVSLMTAIAGWRSDRLGRRVPWIRVGYALPMFGKALVALASTWPQVLGGRLLDRFGKGLRASPRDALIADLVPMGERGRAFGVHRALDTVGALAGVLIAASMIWWMAPSATPGAPAAETSGSVFRTVFWVAAVLGLGSFVLTLFVREPASAAVASPRGSGVDTNAAAVAAPAASRKLPGRFWAVFGVLIVFALASSSDAFLLLRAHDLGLSALGVILLYALFNVTYAAASYPAGVWSDRVGRWRVITVGWILYAVVYAGFAFGNAVALWPLMAAYGVCTALTDGVGKALIADQVPLGSRGTALGIFHAANGIVTLGASLIAGQLWDTCGPAPAFLAGAGFAVAALVVLAVVRRRV